MAIFSKKKKKKRAYKYNRNAKTWEKYRKQRNYVNKLKKRPVNADVLVVLNLKHISSESKIILSENSNFVTDQREENEIFNEFIS